MRRYGMALLALALAAALVVVAARITPKAALSAPPGGKAAGARDDKPDGPATRPNRGPRDRRGRGGPMRRRFFRPMKPEDEKELLEYYKTRRPEVHKQLLNDREKDPRRYRRMLRSFWQFYSMTRKLPKEVREAHETRQAAFVAMWRLAKQYSAADEKDKAGIEKQMTQLARTHFDADQIVREHRLTQLADQIKHLRTELKQRAADRASVIGETVDRMKKDADRYGSRPGPGGGPDRPGPPPPPPPPHDKQPGGGK